MKINPDLIIPNKSLTLLEGAIRPWANLLNKWDEYINALKYINKKYKIPIDIPVEKMKKKDLDVVYYGTSTKATRRRVAFNGVFAFYLLNKKLQTSPSCITYSFPSVRRRPCSRALASDPAFTKS